MLFIALLVATLGLPTAIIQSSASAAARVTPATNPDLVASCGLDVVLVLDASGSIDTANAENDVKAAANTFLEAFKDTNTRIGIVKFSTKAPSEGTGLALSEVRRIAHMHGGEATYDPAESPGATFRLWLPQCHGTAFGATAKARRMPETRLGTAKSLQLEFT